MIRILIADDHAIVRAGLRQFIADQPDMEVTGEAASGSEALGYVKGRQVDLVLSDCRMPGMSGPELLLGIRAVLAESFELDSAEIRILHWARLH